MKKKKRTWILWLLLALLAAGLAVLPTVAARQAKASGANMEVRSLSPEYRSIDTQILGGGQLISKGVFDLEIPAKVKLTRFLVANGDTVTEGTPIAEVDPVSVMSAIAGVQDTLTELSKQINAKATSSSDSYLKAAAAGRVKKVYARPGDSVQDVMLAHGCLAVLSLDDTMQVTLTVEEVFNPGYKVDVILPGGSRVTGRVRSCVDGELVVTLEDENYALDTQVQVQKKDGSLIGSGPLAVASPWNLTAYDGTVTYVSMTEESRVYANQSLLTVRVEGHSAEYQSLVDKRQKYEDLMRELVQLHDKGVITAPCDGIISGVDNNAAFLLADEAGEGHTALTLENAGSWRIELLSNEDPKNKETLRITTETLPDGTIGTSYSAQLSAVIDDGTEETPASGTWTVTGLPAGLVLSDEAAGTITGTPTQKFNSTVEVTFACEGWDEVNRTVALKIDEAPAKYKAYVAMVNDVHYGEKETTVNFTYCEEMIPVKDPDTLPTVIPQNYPLTKESYFSSPLIPEGMFQKDYFIVIQEAETERMIKIVNLSASAGGSTFPGAGTKPGTGMGGMSGLAGLIGSLGGSRSGLSGYAGYGGLIPEDDGLYGLGKTVIATVTSQEHMSVSVVVDELDITSVYVGQKASVTMNSFTGEKLDAVITSIGNSGTNAGGSSKFTVEMELSRTSNMLPGMNITAVITLATEEHALCIPAEALYQEGGRSFVYTAKNPKTGELSNPVDVTLGKADADYVQVLSGLDESSVIYYEHYEPQPEIPGPPQAM